MTAPTPPGSPARPPIVALLALAEEYPDVGELEPFLADGDAIVRRAALDVLTEGTPPGTALALAAALGDPDEGVRDAAVDGLRELREVIDADAAFAAALGRHEGSPHCSTRVAVTRLRWEHRIGELEHYRRALADPEAAVRREAVAGLVSLDAIDELVGATTDPDPLVRLGVARGIGAVGDPRGAAALDALADDVDRRVRVAAIETYATVGCPQRSVGAVLAAVADDAWELRKAAATALRAVPPGDAVDPLLGLAVDVHMDVRRAAVQSLARWVAERDDARKAIEAATSDPDADVRGYARLALG